MNEIISPDNWNTSSDLDVWRWQKFSHIKSTEHRDYLLRRSFTSELMLLRRGQKKEMLKSDVDG